MGINQAGLALTKNIERLLEDKEITKGDLCERAAIASSTLYRNLKAPDAFSFKQIGNIAAVFEVPITELVKDPEA